MKGLAARQVIAAIAIAALLLSGLAIGWLVYNYETTHVTIDSTNWAIRNGTIVGYLCENSCTTTSISTTTGALLTLQVSIYGTGQTVSAISAEPNFSLVSVFSSTPPTISSPGSVTFNVTVEVPTSAGTYNFVGTIWESFD
jgi:hypothetical protein